MAENGLEPRIPESWVHPTYWLTTWEEMYSFKINPCVGPEIWPPLDSPIILTPPDYHTPIGRPPKKRKKSDAELYDNMVKEGKLSTAGKQLLVRNVIRKVTIVDLVQVDHHNLSQAKDQKKKQTNPCAPSQSSQRPSKAKKTPCAPSQSSQRPVAPSESHSTPVAPIQSTLVAPSQSTPSQVALSQSKTSQVAPNACIISSEPSQVFLASRLSPLKGSISNVRFSKPIIPYPSAGPSDKEKESLWIDYYDFLTIMTCLFLLYPSMSV